MNLHKYVQNLPKSAKIVIVLICIIASMSFGPYAYQLAKKDGPFALLFLLSLCAVVISYFLIIRNNVDSGKRNVKVRWFVVLVVLVIVAIVSFYMTLKSALEPIL